MKNLTISLFFMLLALSCQKQKNYTVDQTSVNPGSMVTLGKKSVNLYDGHFKIGDQFSSLIKETLGEDLLGKVAVINVVPSIDTPVCEEQSHILGETKTLSKEIARLTVSRDLPMAQERFAKEAKLTNVTYLSDYKFAEFGKKTGLLMQGNELLARAVLVVDRQGYLRYFQVVPDVSHLPDMKKAFDVAETVLSEK